MMMPPKKQFKHTITQVVAGEPDVWGNPTQETARLIPHVYFNVASKFSRSGINSTEQAPNASITILKRYTPVIPTFDLGQTIQFDDKRYTVVLVKPLEVLGEFIGLRLEVV